MFFQLTLFGSSFLVVDMLHATGGGFGLYWCPSLLVVCLVWAACLPGLWSLPLVSFLSLGAFFLFKFGKVSSF
jgi:hypothetical protein